MYEDKAHDEDMRVLMREQLEAEQFDDEESDDEDFDFE